MKPTFVMTAVLLFAGNMAFAAVTADSIAADLMAQGFTNIEIRQGNGTISVEATLGADRVETVYDAATGTVLRSHVSGSGSDGSTSKSSSMKDHSDDDDHDSHDDDSSHDDNDDDHDGGDHDGGSDHDSSDDSKDD